MSATDNDRQAGVSAFLTSARRLDVLHSFVADIAEPDADFRALAEIAADLFEAPVALVTLLDRHDQWFKAAIGTGERRAPSDESFCAHTIAGVADETLVVNDATTDVRFRTQPRVAGAPFLRFYAGVPIIIEEQPVGTICVFDVKPRHDISPESSDPASPFVACGLVPVCAEA